MEGVDCPEAMETESEGTEGEAALPMLAEVAARGLLAAAAKQNPLPP